MADNRHTPGMDRLRKQTYLARFIKRDGYTRFERTLFNLKGFSMRVIGLVSPKRKQWKGYTCFQPRCGFRDKPWPCTAPVLKDMQKCELHGG